MSRKIKHRVQANKAPPSIYPKARAELWVTCLGLLYYVARGGWTSLNPLNIDWLRKTNDWTQHYLGWAFGRQAPWSFPFGAIPDLGRPVGATIALMDANPLVSLLLKPFSNLLPASFQFIGPWMGLCMALQGFFGVKLTRAILPEKLAERALLPGLGGALFVVAPIVLHRLDHDTLMAHFLILGSLWLCFLTNRPLELSWAVRRRYLIGLSVVAAGVHPYLLAMAAPFLAVALFYGVQQNVQPRSGASLKATGLVILWLSAICAELWSLGYVSSADSVGSFGFGFFNADISALFNPIGWSRLLPTLPYDRGQFYEGFGFLGLGALGLWGFATIKGLWHPSLFRAKRPTVLACVAALIMAFFALSNQIHWLGETVLSLPHLYSWMDPVPAILRSSGRFFWPLHYLILTFSLFVISRVLSERAAICAVGLAVLATALDLKPEKVRERLSVAPFEALTSPMWEEAAFETRHVVMLPPLFSASSAGECAPWPSPGKFEIPPSFFAAAHGMSINSVYASRARSKISHEYCKRILAEATRGDTRSDSLYLVDPRLVGTVVYGKNSKLTCWQVDNRIGCVDRDHPRRKRLENIIQGAIPLR